ncbi:MAG: GH25 family lysozyme [Paracoccaceae bacterium]
MRIPLFLAALAVSLVACARQSPEAIATPEATAAAAEPRVSLRSAPARTRVRFDDADPYEWERRKPWNYAVHGIDISRWQGAIDWQRIRREGISFAFIKATEGGDVFDPKFTQHWAGAKSAGIAYSAYHFYYFCRPAEEQARWFIRNVPRDANAMPHVLDMEWNHQSRTCRLRPDPETVRSEARKFLNMLEAHYGQRPIVYTTPDFYAETGIWRLGRTEFWLRSVAGHPSEVYPGGHWSFWQYTGTGLVPGIEGKVDINVFGGSVDEWRAWRRPLVTPES